jgi:hypothetical protein
VPAGDFRAGFLAGFVTVDRGAAVFRVALLFVDFLAADFRPDFLLVAFFLAGVIAAIRSCGRLVGRLS